MHNGSDIIHIGGPPPRPKPPTVEVERVPGTHLLVMRICPHCSQRHMHGSGSKMTCGFHGHRTSHCTSPWLPNVGYYLYEPCTSATAAKPKATTARHPPPRPRAKRALRDFRRESDPHIRATLLRRLLHRHGLSHEEIDTVLAALEREREQGRNP